MSLFPNPNKGSFTVLIQSKKEFDAVLSIYTMNGKLVNKTPLRVKSGIISIDINLKQISQGLYQVRLSSGEASMNKKLLINKP